MQQVGGTLMLDGGKALVSPLRARPGLGALDSKDGRQKKKIHTAAEENIGGPVFTFRLSPKFPVTAKSDSVLALPPLPLSSLLPDTQPSCSASAPPLVWTAPDADVRAAAAA